MKAKHLSLIVTLFFSISTISAQDNTESEGVLTGPKIFFAKKSYDFGDIVQGEKVEYVFELENTGNEPLILTDVKTTCGCTAPEWPREPIEPGQKESLKVVFNSAGKVGMQNKVITVMSNAVNSPARVKIVTNVLTKDAESDSGDNQ
ncbi:MAG: DUF1573 domain-containing protein [Ekhidna sp.]|nr:DUF1573 domain-containing protein [Ekhidna sp.]